MTVRSSAEPSYDWETLLHLQGYSQRLFFDSTVLESCHELTANATPDQLTTRLAPLRKKQQAEEDDREEST